MRGHVVVCAQCVYNGVQEHQCLMKALVGVDVMLFVISFRSLMKLPADVIHTITHQTHQVHQIVQV